MKSRDSPQRLNSSKRKVTVIACNACRSRRTRCGGQRPVCSFCQSRNLDCQYEKPRAPQPSSVEFELARIHQRLDDVSALLTSAPNNSNLAGSSHSDLIPFNQDERSPFELLGTQAMMTILGLSPNFAQQLRLLERAASLGAGLSSARLYMVTHQQALSALAAFSAHVHIWYPIFRPGFSEQYFRVISGPLVPSPESCLTLLVTAIGLVVRDGPSRGGLQPDSVHSPYFEAAIASLPLVLTDDSITGAQCLILLSIYYCCLSKPCHALDYCLIASLKVQNCLRNVANDDQETSERLRRAYWVVLLLESELRVQFSVPDSGIWSLDDEISLPDSRTTWHFDIDTGSPAASATPSSMVSTMSASTDKVQSYFLAEIAMRRMLHRCNTAIRRTPDGKITYAPGIAIELELQLDEWYNYLPSLVRFDSDEDNEPLGLETHTSGISSSSPCPLTNFLRVQYHCCKISIYWPAIYQAINEGLEDDQLLDHCQRFWNSYLRLVPSIMIAFHECIVNRWTLYASIFMTTMAALKGAMSPALQDTVDMTKLRQSFAMTRTADQFMIETSPSLSLLAQNLEQKLAEEFSSPPLVLDPGTIDL